MADNISNQVKLEREEIAALYEAAVKDGGELVIYAGGDTPTQQDFVTDAFRKAFPSVNIKMIVDYSKFHDVRYEYQLDVNKVIPDVIQLQTLHDFTRWKQLEKIQAFKPAGFDHIHPLLKDPDGAWISVFVIAFGYYCNLDAIPGRSFISPRELSKPEWRGKVASSYPQDDDAALFLFKKYVEAYGFDWLEAMATQQLQFNRGTNTPGEAVYRGEKAIGLAGSGSYLDTSSSIRWLIDRHDPFVGWGQRAAIVKNARNLNAAKLYLSWQTSTEAQLYAWNGWSVRTDVTPSKELPPIWEYENAYITEFINFMHDRYEVERWRQTFMLHFGEAKGAPSPGWLGVFPGQ